MQTRNVVSTYGKLVLGSVLSLSTVMFADVAMAATTLQSVAARADGRLQLSFDADIGQLSAASFATLAEADGERMQGGSLELSGGEVLTQQLNLRPGVTYVLTLDQDEVQDASGAGNAAISYAFTVPNDFAAAFADADSEANFSWRPSLPKPPRIHLPPVHIPPVRIPPVRIPPVRIPRLPAPPTRHEDHRTRYSNDYATFLNAVRNGHWTGIHVAADVNTGFAIGKLVYARHPEYFAGAFNMNGSRDGAGSAINVVLTPEQVSLINLGKTQAMQVARAVPAGDEASRFYWIHNYIVNSTVYDTLPGPNYPVRDYTAAGALVYGVAVCQGYTAAFNLISYYAGGLFSIGVSGFGNGGAHAWNKVLINGGSAFIDATWDDPKGPQRTLSTYFNVDQGRMRVDHAWNDADYPDAAIRSDRSM